MPHPHPIKAGRFPSISPSQFLLGKVPQQQLVSLTSDQRLILQYQALLLVIWGCAFFLALVASFLMGGDAAFAAGQWVRFHGLSW